ncbi:hypothetical protein KC19_7G137000 [Ceratodon purpureus]|uniref:Nascent polypeptide-associated complex subunit alpha-like UBA domain-containing protein n=1 Tax=Ceratodon purpureus TaxID=3225 RepID=A0A8T0HBC8_CERPU|nr:hypothetical protein KC19_7G137000 [Ceratodon purpureus]
MGVRKAQRERERGRERSCELRLLRSTGSRIRQEVVCGEVDRRAWWNLSSFAGNFSEFEAVLREGAAMADEGVEVAKPDSKDLQQQSKALDSLTDHVEDRQLDSTRVQQAMASIAATSDADRNAQRLREKELAAVKINAEDVDIIASELKM